MSVSLTKNYVPVAAGNAVPGTEFLLRPDLPVRVTNTHTHGARITLSVTTPNGALIVRTYPVGTTFAPVPANRPTSVRG